MQSPEYPDLPWVEPRAWNRGRAPGQPSLVVIHTTEGSEGLRSAEDGAAYDARRTDGTSAHYFHDQDTTVQCVRTTDRANTARGTGNQRGIHHELCGKAAQTPAQWDDAASGGTLRNAAKQCARDATKHGIPVRKLTVAQVRAGERGFCGHDDISEAFGESDHTDPGRHFPWGEFLVMVKGYQDMSFDEDRVPVKYPKVNPENPTWTGPNALGSARDYAHKTYDVVVAQGKALTLLLNKILAKDTFDEVAFAKELAPSLAAAVVAALPPDRDDVTVEELTAAIRALITPAGQ